MSHFSFKLSSRIIVGDYSLEKLGLEASRYGKQCFFIIDHSMQDSGLVKKITELLEHQGLSVLRFINESTAVRFDVLEHTLTLAHGACADMVVAAGDAATVTIGRAVAAVYNETKPITTLIEEQLCTAEPLPFFEIPTVCYHSFAFTPFIPLFDIHDKKIHFLKLSHEVCTLCVYDPACYANTPSHSSAVILLHSLSDALEGYIATNHNFFSDTLLLKAITMLWRALQLDTAAALSDVSRRTLMAEAACLLAMGLSCASAGVSAAVALYCTGLYGTESSSIAALLLPHLVMYAADSNKDKIVAIGKLFAPAIETDDSEAVVQVAIEALQKIIAQAQLPQYLSELQLNAEQLRIIAEDVVATRFMNYIPKPMTNDDVFAWLEAAL
ncbi:MAG: iron-containing alcohol dehydrogenase [Treponema sp.]